MLTSLLAEGNNAGTSGGIFDNLIPLIILVIFVAVIFVFYFISSKKRKKQEQDAKDLINAVKPGNKVKTIGGICGIVVEVDDEENTFVLETGTETSGKSYIKFDKQAIYQTDAVVEKSMGSETSEAEGTPVEAAEPLVTDTPVEATEEKAEQPAMVKTKKNAKKDEE